MKTCKTLRRPVAASLALMLLLLCGGCQFRTRVLLDSPPPEKVLESFFTALKQNRYDSCDTYLADHATFVVTDSSAYHFMDTLVEETVRHVSYETLEQPRYDNLKATQRVAVTSVNYETMVAWMRDNIKRIQYDYMVENGQNSLDPDNKDDVSAVLAAAIREYAEKPETVTNTVTVRYVYQDRAWRIQADADLIAAVYGGITDE